MNLVICSSYIGFSEILRSGIPENAFILTHNKSIKRQFKRLGFRTVLIASVLPSNGLRLFFLFILLYFYQFSVKIFTFFSRKSIQKVYHDIQGYGFSDYVIIKTLSLNFPVYRYVDVELPDLGIGREISYMQSLFGLEVIKTIVDSETFYYFPSVPGELTKLKGVLLSKDISSCNNVIFLYLGGVVESGLCSREDYVSVLNILKNKLPKCNTRIKMHPRFSETIERSIFNKFDFIPSDLPSEIVVGENCLAVGFQSFALTNPNLGKSVSLLRLLENTSQNKAYVDYLMKNGEKIVFPIKSDEIYKIFSEYSQTF